MGGRLLRSWLLNPLNASFQAINRRLDAVEEMVNKNSFRIEIRELLSEIRDIERLSSRIAVGMANARDMVALSLSINTLPGISHLLNQYGSKISELLQKLPENLLELGKKISETIQDNPPAVITEGGLIKTGI